MVQNQKIIKKQINMDINNYKRAKTEKLCPAKCQGMSFIIYTDGTVKCQTCKKISLIEDLISVY